MNGLDIDGTLPGQELDDDDEQEETIRRELESDSSDSASFSSTDTWSSDSTPDKESLRGWLYLVAGAGYGLLVVYLFLVIYNCTL